MMTTKNSQAYPFLKWYLVAICVLLLDQISKVYFLKTLVQEGNTISVIEPILNWTLAYNRGAAFSFLANQGGWQKFFFAGLALIVSLFLIWYIRVVPKQAKVLSLALALILGGAFGNLIDRMAYGYVIDFIHVHYANVWHYPVFNIADIGVVTGVFLMIFDMLFLEKKRNPQNKTD
ncbi:MAG: lipoprotein signal peptidase [Moraxellaceae bacterium]|nr:lipoprotein signal peptidase [Moraxellaceae bacterium]